jgi:signal transduction histidine kinase
VARTSFASNNRQVLLGFVIALAALGSVRLLVRTRVMALQRATERVDHTHRVLGAIAAVDARLVDVMLAARVDALGEGAGHRSAPGTVPREADAALDRLRALTGDDASRQPRMDTLQVRARQVLASPRSDIPMMRYRAISARLTSEAEQLLLQRGAAQVRERTTLSRAMVAGALAVILLAVGAALRVRSALQVRVQAEAERDEHARALELTAREVAARNEELIAQREALRLAMSNAEIANRAKSMFLAQMSHELRTPLNSVIGFANIVRRNTRGALSDAELTYLERIAANGGQLLRTIDNILDLSKIEAERETVELELVRLDVLVREVVAQLEPQAMAGRVALDAEVPSPLASIVSDSEKLRRVLINLVANAVKFTRAGGRVVVRIETAPRSRTTPVAIEVRDNGIGIAPDRLAVIFDAFEQGDVGVGREYGGTGLGLSISRALCRLLRCELAVSSVAGAGSVFRIGLPLDDVVVRPAGGAPLDMTRPTRQR